MQHTSAKRTPVLLPRQPEVANFLTTRPESEQEHVSELAAALIAADAELRATLEEARRVADRRQRLLHEDALDSGAATEFGLILLRRDQLPTRAEAAGRQLAYATARYAAAVAQSADRAIAEAGAILGDPVTRQRQQRLTDVVHGRFTGFDFDPGAEWARFRGRDRDIDAQRQEARAELDELARTLAPAATAAQQAERAVAAVRGHCESRFGRYPIDPAAVERFADLQRRAVEAILE